jgi:rod shape-determining protein MreD
MRPQAVIGRAPSLRFIAATMAAALVFNFLPWAPNWPVPDMLAIVLVFWNIFLPSRIGLAPAWLLGLVMDVHQGVLLGQHALAYSILSYGAITLHRRIPDFQAWGQVAHLYPLFLVSLASVFAVRWMVEALLWVFVSRIIQLVLQRKSRPGRMRTRKPVAPVKT